MPLPVPLPLPLPQPGQQGQKGLRRRLGLQKLLGARALPAAAPVDGQGLPVDVQNLKLKLSKRVRFSAFVTKLKLRAKGQKVPATGPVIKSVPVQQMGAPAVLPHKAGLPRAPHKL